METVMQMPNLDVRVHLNRLKAIMAQAHDCGSFHELVFYRLIREKGAIVAVMHAS